MRKFHNKSRLGCKQCKVRRVKCDEQHPACRKCKHASIECSFLSAVPSMPWAPNCAKSAPKITELRVEALSAKRDRSNPFVFEPLPLKTSLVDPPSRTPSPAADEQFGTVHLRLLRHFQHDFFLSEKDVHPGLEVLLNLYLEQAWTTPYLLEEILAYAAAHRSIKDWKNQDSYLCESKTLQTRALTLYNSEGLALFDETCLPMFLFASLLSHHIIFEAGLGVKNDLRPAIESLTHSIAIHRGLVAIAQAAWPLFSEEIRQTFIRTCRRDCNPLPFGTNSRGECEALLMRLEDSAMDPDVKAVYRSTVKLLQDRFDAVSFQDTHSLWAAIQDWLAAVPHAYIELLRQLQPGALVILAHFSVLLYFASEHWFVGDLGVRLVCLIKEHLGARWADWLDWPVRTIKSSMEAY